MPDWFIRQATPNDAAQIIAYKTLLTHEPLNNTSVRRSLVALDAKAERRHLRHLLSQPNSTVIVADCDGEIVGMIEARGGDTPFTTHVVDFSINVRDDFRGLGIGSALIDTMIRWAAETGCIHRVQLEVLTRNEGATRLYLRHGFAIEGRRHASYYLFDEGRNAAFVDSLTMAYYL